MAGRQRAGIDFLIIKGFGGAKPGVALYNILDKQASLVPASHATVLPSDYIRDMPFISWSSPLK